MSQLHVSPGDGPQGVVQVRVGRIGHINVHQVREDELIQLERGSDGGLYLNFAIFFMSSAIACSTSLATATFTNEIVKDVNVAISVLGAGGAIVFLILWYRDRSSIKKICETIRKRLPPSEE